VEFLDENCAFAALSQSSGLTLHDKKLVVKPREIKPSTKSASADLGSKKPAKPIASKKPLKAPRSKIIMDGSPSTDGIHQGEHPLLSDDVIKQLNSVNSVSLFSYHSTKFC